VRTETDKLICFYGDKISWELFDLIKDPHELNNLYAVKGFEKTTKNLMKKLKQLIEQYKDDEALRTLPKM